MAWGARKGTRVIFERAIDVHIMGIDGTWRRDCQLADVSASGARLIVSGSMENLNLKEFFLSLTPNGAVFRRCELVRVNGDEIGVRFLKKSEARKSARRSASVPAEVE
jgi:PilZ domain